VKVDAEDDFARLLIRATKPRAASIEGNEIVSLDKWRI